MEDKLRKILSEHPSIPPEKLLAYLEGRLGEQDRIEVEMAMVESEFLSDAAEGLSQIHDSARISHMVDEINRGLRRSTKRSKRRLLDLQTGFPLWLAFAAILLLILIIAGFFVLSMMTRS